MKCIFLCDILQPPNYNKCFLIIPFSAITLGIFIMMNYKTLYGAFWLVEITYYFAIGTAAIVHIQAFFFLMLVNWMELLQCILGKGDVRVEDVAQTLSATFCTPGIVCSDTTGCHGTGASIPCRWKKPYFLWSLLLAGAPGSWNFSGLHSTNERQLQNVFIRFVWPSTRTCGHRVLTLPQKPKGAMQVRLWNSTHGYLEGRLEFMRGLVLF